MGVFQTKTAKMLYTIGIAIIVIGIFGSTIGFKSVIPTHLQSIYGILLLLLFLGSLFQGSLLIGIAKLIERAHSKTST